MNLRRVPRSVFALGWVSFFTDLASEMLYPIIPLFVVQTLGASPALLGLIDGLAEGISSGLRWLGGALSDRSGRRKPFIFAGYSISALSKPLMGLAAVVGGWPVFLLGRCTDRLGKSIRTGARDALIADSADPASRGIAFGLHRAMDTCGAVAGPLVALLVLHLRPGTNLGWLFAVALGPGLVSAVLVLLAVDERTKPPGEGKPPAIFQRYPRAFWSVFLAMAVFAVANSSDSFLLLRSKELGLSTSAVILAFAIYNAVYALAATPFGHLSDRVGRRGVIAAGWVVYAVVYLAFAAARGGWAPWALLATYGLYQALAEGVTKALVSDVVPPTQRAGAIGLIYTAAGLGQLIGSVVAGATWGRTVPGTSLLVPFTIGGTLALAAAGMLLLVKPRSRADLQDASPSMSPAVIQQ